VDIPQQGDVNKVWKTEATRALPLLSRAGKCGTTKKTKNAAHANSLLGTNGNFGLYPIWGTDSMHLTQNQTNFYSRAMRVPRRDGAVLAYLGGLLLVVAVLVGGLAGADIGTFSVWAVLALSFVAAAFERSSVQLSRTTETSIALLPVVFAGVLFGPAASMVVAAASMLTDFSSPYLKWAVYTCSRSITGAAAGLVAVGVEALVGNRLTSLAVATVTAAVTAELLDLGFAASMRALRRNGRPADIVKLLAPLALASVPLYAPIVALLAIAYEEVSPWTLPLFFVPALAAQRLFTLYQEQSELAAKLLNANSRLERANLSFATALVATLDARDRYTAGHSAAVAVYARDIAERLGMTDEEQQLAHLCGLVHDIGKVGLPPGLLEKPGPLTLEERRQMEEHSAIGERILAKVENYAEIARIVRHHHERIDGNGYPDELRGGDIPMISRILAVADAYDAMTSDRPYRDAMPSRVARLRMAQAVETQFDTAVVAAFEAILAGAPESYREGSAASWDAEVARPALIAAAV
jgi:putative nucleotidyltransferase with HDIG domain